MACRDRCEADVATLLAINRNALQYARTTKQVRYLGPVMFIAIGVLLTTMGLSYRDIDIAIYAGITVVFVGMAFLVIQHRMAKGLKA